MEHAIAGVAVLGVAALCALIVAEVVRQYRRIGCRHDRHVVRFWLPRSRFVCVCQDCGRTTAKGRDPLRRKPGRAA